jgi:hypothetical protein
VSTSAPDVARQRARHEHGRLALEKVLAGCREAGIDALPVKGILTGRLFYQDPGERPIQDVDLRVRPGDIDRLWQSGPAFGWRPLSRSRAYGTLGFDVLGFLVEFESHVGPPGLCGLAVDDMLKRATASVEPLGMPHLQPELHDHALLLCVNAFKDKLVEAMPGAVRDLELVPDQPGFEGERLVTLAQATGSATIVGIVADWLTSVRQCAAWSQLRAMLGRLPRPRYETLFARAIRTPRVPRAALRVLARVGADRRSDGVRALGAMAAQAVEDASAALANVGRAPRTQPPVTPCSQR